MKTLRIALALIALVALLPACQQTGGGGTTTGGGGLSPFTPATSQVVVAFLPATSQDFERLWAGTAGTPAPDNTLASCRPVEPVVITSSTISTWSLSTGPLTRNASRRLRLRWAALNPDW